MDHFTFLYDRDAFGRFWGYIRELDLEIDAPNFRNLTELAIITIQQTTGVDDPQLVFVNIGTGWAPQ